MSNIERRFDSLVDQISDMAEGVAVSENISNFDLRRVLRFLSKVIQVVEQAFQDVLTIMIEFKYVTDEDFQSGRILQLAKELDLLGARSRYRDAEEICSRLHHLGDFYRSEIEPITSNLPQQNHWWGVFQLLDEYEGQIIVLVNESVWELRNLLLGTDTQKINWVAERHFEAIKESLTKLRSLNSQILGLSGNVGLLELTGDSTSPSRSKILINRGGLRMGDTYRVGQAGAVGPGAHAHDMNLNQIWNESSGTIDVAQLARELKELRNALSKEASEPEQYVALGEVAAAEKAAGEGNGPKALEHLKKAGSWVWDAATKIGIGVATAAAKTALGF